VAPQVESAHRHPPRRPVDVARPWAVDRDEVPGGGLTLARRRFQPREWGRHPCPRAGQSCPGEQTHRRPCWQAEDTSTTSLPAVTDPPAIAPTRGRRTHRPGADHAVALETRWKNSCAPLCAVLPAGEDPGRRAAAVPAGALVSGGGVPYPARPPMTAGQGSEPGAPRRGQDFGQGSARTVALPRPQRGDSRLSALDR
jgi:hypothetical protein